MSELSPTRRVRVLGSEIAFARSPCFELVQDGHWSVWEHVGGLPQCAGPE